MVAKLVIGLVALIALLAIVFGLAFWYFNQRGERRHEEKLRRMEQTEHIVSGVEDDPIDRELDRERNR